MLVKDRMTPNPETVTTDTSLKEALDLIRSRPFRHLPVLDENGKLAGIVTEKSLVYASPTPTTTLSVFEVDYILSRTKIGQVIQGPVITVGPDLPIEEAARLMVDHRIGCLPVVEDDELIGIISDTDIFRAFVEASLSRRRWVAWRGSRAVLRPWVATSTRWACSGVSGPRTASSPSVWRA